MEIWENGVYFVSDSFFNTFPSPYWMQNKNENRPHYYAFMDRSGLIWMIPMSSQVEKYKAKIQNEEKKHGTGNCVFYCVGKFAGKEQAFIISGMFPVTKEYIIRPYEIGGIPYRVKNSSLNKALISKAKRYLALLKSKKFTDNNHILQIEKILLDK